MTLHKPTRPRPSTICKQNPIDTLYEAERQHRAAVRASLPPRERGQLDVVYAKLHLENRRNGHAQAVIHCPIGTRLLQTECHDNLRRAWYFQRDADTGEEWCIFILASTHDLYRTDAGCSDNAPGTDDEYTHVLADTIVRHAYNRRSDVALAKRVQAHLLARKPLKIFRRCESNEMEAIGYGQPVGEGSAFIQTTSYASVAALEQAYPMLAKSINRLRAQRAVGHLQVRFNLEVRSSPWSVDNVDTGGHSIDWSTLLAVMDAAK